MSKKPKNNNDPSSEVVATSQETTPQKAKRRTFSAKYKRRILQEYEACTERGEKGALLRREGIYSSYITTWRRQRERGELGNSKSKKRGPKTDPKDAELSKLEEENERLRERLKQAELIIEAQLSKIRRAKKSLRYLVSRRPRTTSRNDPGGRDVSGGSGHILGLSSTWGSQEFFLLRSKIKEALSTRLPSTSTQPR